MAEQDRRFELLYGGHKLFSPEDTYLVYRSDHMVGDGGRVMVLSVGTDAKTEVEYGALSRTTWREVALDGVTVVRIRRTLNGNIVGEWAVPGQESRGDVPARAETPMRAETAPQGATAGEAAPGDALANILGVAGRLLGQSPRSGLRTFGSMLADVSQQLGARADPARAARETLPPLPASGPPPVPVQVESAPQAEREPVRVTPEQPLPKPQIPPVPIPLERRCTACAHYRPYVRISTSFRQELGPAANDDGVARALTELIGQEDRGKGEEAKLLAALYKRGANRWGDHPPSFFRYCAAQARDTEEPTYFIAQIRNAGSRCEPVRRVDGQRFNHAATDFVPRDPVPHSCGTCAHRVRATGPGEDAEELRRIVRGAVVAEQMNADVGGRSGGAGAVLSSYPAESRRVAAAARAHEMTEAFARRGDAGSHVSSVPRYLDHCRLKSDPAHRRYRVCAVENANEMCPDWTDGRTPR
jgi:hypothetical protein